MSPVTVTAAALTDDVVTLTVDTISGLRVGYKVTVQGVNTDPQPHFDGTHTLTGVITTTVGDVTTYTVTYDKNHNGDIPEYDCLGYVRVVCQWIGTADVEDWLGIPPVSAADEAYLDSCVESANQWSWDRRQAAGYLTDLANVAPNQSVILGTVMYAGTLYRERASVDSFTSFQDLPTVAPVGNLGQILRLLGCNKPKVA